MSDEDPKPLGVLPLGDAAAYVEFSEALDLEINDVVQRLAAAVRARAVPWMRDVVPALGGLALHFDVDHAALPEAPLQAAAELVKLAPEEVARRHAAREYRVLMMGFSPGLPYLGGLDPSIAVPRRATPRATVPAGSVAIANLQAVVYPYAIPGGWSVIGRTPLTVFDARRGAPSLFAPGDRVHFRPVARAEFERLREAPRPAP